jgi:hypothetical protein
MVCRRQGENDEVIEEIGYLDEDVEGGKGGARLDRIGDQGL